MQRQRQHEQFLDNIMEFSEKDRDVLALIAEGDKMIPGR